jgi:hypothetical protein
MTLLYKPNLEQAVERHRLLWTRRFGQGILATIEAERAPLGQLASTVARFAPDLEAMMAVWEERLARRRQLLDDSFPVSRVSYGSNAFGGYLGADVVFSEGGGWSHPLLEEWSALGDLGYDENNEWIRLQEETCRFFAERAAGRFAVCETEVIDALNLADLLRGTDRALLDIYDHPTELRQLMALGVTFNAQLIEMQRRLLGPSVHYGGGVFSLHYIWLPGEAIWLSVDAYGMCRPRVFAEFGREYVQQLVDHFGGGWLHLHANALHLLPEALKLKRLLGISICEDPGQARPFERLDEIRAITGDMPLEVWCHKDELLRGMRSGTLAGGILYRVDEVQTVEEGNTLMEEIRAYRAPAA